MNSSAEKSHRPWWAGWLGSALVYTAYAMVASFAMVIGLGFYSHWSHAKENLRIDSRQLIRSVEQAVYHYRTDNPGGCPASVADLVAQKYLTRVPKDLNGHMVVMRCPGTHDPQGIDFVLPGDDEKIDTHDDIRSWAP